MAAIDFVRPLCAGIDEAGRGCLAGPVVAAAVILPYGFELPGLDDSKALSAKKRARLEIQIKECARAYGLGVVWPVKIDSINILQATFAAMAHAVSRLKLNPGLLLIDGNQAIPPHILEEALARSEKTLPRQKTVVHGDSLEPAISAASILAKTFRDRIMIALDRHFCGYGFARHKGYGTRDHLASLRKFGPTSMHRKTFRGVLPDNGPVQGSLWQQSNEK